MVFRKLIASLSGSNASSTPASPANADLCKAIIVDLAAARDGSVAYCGSCKQGAIANASKCICGVAWTLSGANTPEKDRVETLTRPNGNGPIRPFFALVAINGAPDNVKLTVTTTFAVSSGSTGSTGRPATQRPNPHSVDHDGIRPTYNGDGTMGPGQR